MATYRPIGNVLRSIITLTAALAVVACGGGAPAASSPGPVATAPAGGLPTAQGNAGGVVADPAPPGEADMTVQGQTLSFPTVSTCDMSVEGEFNFNFLAKDGSDIRAGGFRSGEMGWLGSINVFLLDGSGYNAPLPDATSLTISGNSLVLVGPIGYNPVYSGQDLSAGLPTPQPMGEGTIRATCL